VVSAAEKQMVAGSWMEGVVPEPSGSDDPLGIAGPEENWVALYTRSRREKQVCRACGWYGIRHYLPLWQHHTFSHRSRTYQLPLFPGYLFACLDGAKRRALLGTGAVLGVIVVKAEREFLEELGQIRAALQSGLEFSSVPALKRGEWVRVLRGPLCGIEGVVADLRRRLKRSRLVLNVGILGRGIAVEIDSTDVEKLHRAPADEESRGAECPSIGACQGDR
jgi:hypothetical protein